ncbi:MAG TPA: glycosyltransferase family 1 protein [bacterium]|nr:glycosyltransferase family 1 protein [bacterium]
MILGIDASRSVSTIKKTGVELVSDELLKTISNQQSASSKQTIVYYTPQRIDWLPVENQRILRWPFKFFWTQIRLAWELISHPPEKMFFPVHAMPLLLITSYKLRVTSYFHIIHDIAFKKQPHLYSFRQKLILNLDLFLARKLCTKIFVPTEAVRQDLIQYTKINPKKIIVTPWGYKSINNKQKTANNKKKQILYIGRVEKKKNIENLIKGFEIFHATHPDYKLILAGKIDRRLKIYDLGFKNIEALGYINEKKKYELLRESATLLLVSKEEGFGFPLLEAFDFDLPVIASDIPVLREIGEDACFYADPDSPEDISDKLKKVITDEKLQAQLITAGQERLKQFDWQKTAEQILSEITG